MNAVWTMLPALAAAPSPSPSPTQGPTELEVTPGLAGFVATFAVALACVLLFLSLTRHLRRARANAEEQGIPVEEPKRVGVRRADDGGEGDGPEGGAGSGGDQDAGPDDGSPDGAGPDEDGQGRR